MDCNAPGAFQRLVEIVLSGLSYEIVLVYLDVTIVFDRSFDEHIHRLKLVFNWIREANLKISAKWSLFQTKLVFLIHVVSADTHWSCQSSCCWKIPYTLFQQCCVPLNQVQNIFLQLHDSPASGHLGDKKTLDRIRQLFYWPGLKNDLDSWISGCAIWQKRKKSQAITTRNSALVFLWTISLLVS